MSGLAVQLALLRFPGRALLPDETPPTEVLAFLARQLRTPVTAWASYAERDETRREHLAELQLHLCGHQTAIKQNSPSESRRLPTPDFLTLSMALPARVPP
jgi:TnpA family transposase